MGDAIVVFGHFSLFLALAAAGWAIVASAAGAVTGSRGLVRSGERALHAVTATTVAAALCLIGAFLRDDFRVDYVYLYSSSSQALPYKIGALWGGQSGSLLLWASILAVMGTLMVVTNRGKNRALLPWATAVLGGVTLFFLILLNFIEPPFATSAMRPDGVGLNPQLKNYWMMIHPPMLYLGYVGFTVPFAFAVAALITRRTSDIWFRTTRRWTLCAWFFLGTGILLGSYWAYIELGWGGYWAWDPVENASLMPWLTGTAFLHSVMVQEKKGMLKVWNVLLILLTFALSIFGTFLTRSGIISSVHAFATSEIGPAFGVFLAIIFFGSLALLLSRLDSLRSEARIESVLSRETSFLFNNLILVGIAATVLLLTTFPMLSEAVTGKKVTMGPPIFNLVNVPWALVLLFLVGVGPLIAWRRASTKNLKRNFTIPALVGLWFLLLGLVLDVRAHIEAVTGIGRELVALDVAGVLDQVRELYPAATLGIGAFVLATVALELWRGTRVRMAHHGEPLPVAAGRLVWRNKRRWGGYTVHVGVVVVFFGIAGSSAYQLETVQALRPGQVLGIDGYYLRYEGYRLEAVDDHIGLVADTKLFDARDGRLLAELSPEQRFHPNMQIPVLADAFVRAREATARGGPAGEIAVAETLGLIRELEGRVGREVKTPSTEVAIRKFLSPLAGNRFAEDFYVIPLGIDPATGLANFRVFVNPMVNFLWLGGLIFFLGAQLSVLPDARERRRLQSALALEERAVA